MRPEDRVRAGRLSANDIRPYHTLTKNDARVVDWCVEEVQGTLRANGRAAAPEGHALEDLEDAVALYIIRGHHQETI